MRNVQLYLMTVSNANFLMRKLERKNCKVNLIIQVMNSRLPATLFALKLAYCNARCDTFHKNGSYSFI